MKWMWTGKFYMWIKTSKALLWIRHCTIGFRKRHRIYWIFYWLLASQEELCSVELVAGWVFAALGFSPASCLFSHFLTFPHLHYPAPIPPVTRALMHGAREPYLYLLLHLSSLCCSYLLLITMRSATLLGCLLFWILCTPVTLRWNRR